MPIKYRTGWHTGALILAAQGDYLLALCSDWRETSSGSRWLPKYSSWLRRHQAGPRQGRTDPPSACYKLKSPWTEYGFWIRRRESASHIGGLTSVGWNGLYQSSGALGRDEGLAFSSCTFNRPKCILLCKVLHRYPLFPLFRGISLCIETEISVWYFTNRSTDTFCRVGDFDNNTRRDGGD